MKETFKNLFDGIKKYSSFELYIWLGSLIFLFSSYYFNSLNHFTFCPLSLSGINYCPGCGLGKSVSAILHGKIQQSFNYHYMGIPALIIILIRIKSLIKFKANLEINNMKGENHE
jgi:hypothetical protein